MTEPVQAARAPVLVLAVGNDSRGDDGLGPALAARLEAERLPGVEVQVDYQLQVEHALELAGRSLVVFVDAGHGTPAPFTLQEAVAAPDYLHTTHALPPAAVLEAARRIGVATPPAWVLCVRGESFELGAGLSPAAATHQEAAWPVLLALLRQSTGR